MSALDFFFGYLNEDYPSHYHDSCEFHYILNGSGYLHQGNEVYPLKADVLIFSPPGAEHSLHVEKEITFYYIRYKPEKSSVFPWQELSVLNQMDGESRTTLARLRILLDGDGHSRKAGEHLLLYFLHTLLGDIKVETYSSLPLVKCQNYMADNLSRKVTLQELADLVHLEKHYFCRLFKENTNLSPLVYFEKLKMEAACSMIEQGIRGYRIAENLGFCDETYFCHRFKRVVGMSPGAYRRRGLCKGGISS